MVVTNAEATELVDLVDAVDAVTTLVADPRVDPIGTDVVGTVIDPGLVVPGIGVLSFADASGGRDTSDVDDAGSTSEENPTPEQPRSGVNRTINFETRIEEDPLCISILLFVVKKLGICIFEGVNLVKTRCLNVREHIHPYVPWLNRLSSTWSNDRFAVGVRLSKDLGEEPP